MTDPRPTRPVQAGGTDRLDGTHPVPVRNERPASPESGVAQVIVVAGVRLAFGLEWHPVARPDAPGAELRQAHAAGYRVVARLPDDGWLGLARWIDTGHGAGHGVGHRACHRVHSAVALLVARFAERGAEACLIAAARPAGATDDRPSPVALVGLMDRRPVPGFDRLLPDLDAALAVLQEFRDMHPDHPVRVASHLPARDRIGETMASDVLFGQPDPDTRLRPLRSARWPAVLVGGATTLALAVGFATWLRHERAVERELITAARQAAAAAQARLQANAARSRQLAQQLAQAGRPGAALLDRWRAAIAAMPVSRAGWTLQQVDCDRTAGCVATWARYHGSFETLDALPPGALGPPSMQPDPPDGEDVLAASMRTPLADTGAPPLAAGEALIVARLPPLRLAVNVWGSHLQDLVTAGGATATLHPGVPLLAEADGPSASATAVSARTAPSGVTGMSSATSATSTSNTPGATGMAGVASATGPADPVVAADGAHVVVRLDWRLKDGVWSLPLLQVPPYVVVETLTLNFAPSQISYELSGSLFAHGARY